MKFVCNFYVIIIILRSTRMVENVANFTHDELMLISRKLKPMECMRLLESLYLSIPKDEGHRITRETPVNAWISDHGCLDELTAWNHQFPDKAEPPGRVVMILHLNALGRIDLANHVRRNWNALVSSAKANTFQNMVKQRISRMVMAKEDTDHTLHHTHDGKKKWTRKIQRTKTPRSTNQYINIRLPMIAGAIEDTTSIGQQATAYTNSPKNWKQTTSKHAMIFVIILSALIIIACGIMLFLLRKPLINCLCAAQWSEFCSGSCFDTREKGLQCVGYLEDMNDAETQSINTCPISEINIEGRSCVNSVGTDSRKSFSDTALGNETCTGGTSIENCKLFVEESVEVQTETWPIPCRCHRLEPETCKSEIGTKKKRKKAKSKSKEETKGTKSCLKAMQEIIRPRQKRQTRKGCTFDMKHFQDKILTLLDQEGGICQCCNCNSPGKLNVESRPERHVDRQTKCEKRVEKEEKQSGVTKRERIPTTIQRDDNTVMVYRTSMASNNKSSTMSGRQRESAEKEKNIESSSRRSGSRRAKRARRVQVSASSSELEICNINRKEKRKKRRSKESKKKFSCDS